MYTKGIRKIFEPKDASNFAQAIKESLAIKYNLFLWNERVYLIINKEAHFTGLIIEDFEQQYLED